MYSFFQLRNKTMKQSPLKREKAATYLLGLFRGIDNFDVAVMTAFPLDNFYGLFVQHVFC